VYQMVSLSPQQCIRVLILLHRVGSEILVMLHVCTGICICHVSIVFFSSFFLLSVFCTLLQIKVNI